MKPVRALGFAGCLLALFSILPGALAGNGDESSEYLLKAGFIYNFAKLVEWPADTFPRADAAIVIGVIGEDRFGPLLDSVLKHKSVNGHEFLIRRLQRSDELSACNILIVSPSEASHLEEILERTRQSSVLTIGEVPDFAKRGGVINLVLRDNTVRFEVNAQAAKKKNLTMSSKLLGLATIVQ
jgi:hypothetical protein